MAQVLTSEAPSTLIKPETSPDILPSVNLVNNDITSSNTPPNEPDDSLAPFLKAIAALDPVAKSSLIQSILSELANCQDTGSPPPGEVVKVESPVNVAATDPLHKPVEKSVETVLSTPLSSESSLPVLPKLIPSSTPLPSTSAISPLLPHSMVTLLQRSTSLQTTSPSTERRQTPPAIIPVSPIKLAPISSIPATAQLTPVSNLSTPISILTSSSSALTTPLNIQTPSFIPDTSTPLPILVPVSSNLFSFPSSLLIPSPASIISSSASPLVRPSPLISSDLLISNSSSPFVQTSANDPVLDALRRGNQTPLDNTEELHRQAADLNGKLVEVRCKILQNIADGSVGISGANAEYLEQLFKLEQVIKQLHEGVISEKMVQSPPSVILGGKNLGDTGLSSQQSGTKRKSGPKQSQKPGKKQKHSGGSHGIQLWQFILELLGDRLQKPVIAWTGNGLEFRILNSVELARLWGIRKRNPIMNFDKLSRALRYYYEKNIIKHNPMHRLVYSFCNNPNDMVYNALLTRALETCPPNNEEVAKQPFVFYPYSPSEQSSPITADNNDLLKT